MPRWWSRHETESAESDRATESPDTRARRDVHIGNSAGDHREDATVTRAVARAIPAIARAVDAIARASTAAGAVFYVGAGTSGRLAALDAV